MVVRFWRAAFSIVLSLNTAHALAHAAESSGAYLTEYCSATRGLREVAQDEIKTSSELCKSQSGGLRTGRERFHHFAFVLNQSSDSGLIRTRIPTRSRLRQRDEASRHSYFKPITSTVRFAVYQQISH
jgi:hypothetical protein